MAHQYIEYSHQEIIQLHQYLTNTNYNTQEMEKIFRDIEKVTSAFSFGLKKISERLHEFVSKGTGDDDNIECAYQYLSNFLLQTSQTWQQISENLRSEIIEPYSLIMSNFRNINQKLSAEMKDNVKYIQGVAKNISDQQEEYVRLMQNADKSSLIVERAVEGIEKGIKQRDELVKASEKQIKLKEIAIEAKEDYKKIVEKGNRKLMDYEKKLKESYDQIVLNDDNRIKFSKSIMLSLMKKLTNDQIYQIYLEKLQLLDQRTIQKTSHDLQNQIQRLLLKKSGEEIVNYQQFENVNYEILKTKPQSTLNEWTLVGDVVNEEQMNRVQQYMIDLLTEKDELNDSFHSRNRTLSTSSTKSNQQNYSQDFLYVKQLMQKQPTRQMVLTILQKELSRCRQKQLNDDSFFELGALLRHIVMILDANESDIEEIYQFLSASSKIVKNSQITLISALQKLEIWQNPQKWKSIYENIKFNQNLIKTQEEQINLLKKGIGFVGKGFKKIKQIAHIQTLQISEQEKQQQQKYLILQEITLFLSDLNVSPQVGTDVILSLSFTDPKLERSQVERLLQKLEESNAQQFNLNYQQGKSIKKRKEEKYKKIGLNNYAQKMQYCISQSVKYLNPSDQPHKLLLLSKQYNLHLRQAIEKFNLLYRRLPYNQENIQSRNQNIKVFLRIEQNQMDYPMRKSEAQQDIQQYEEIITMDVQRSLQMHFEKIPSSKLQSLLRTYAYHNEEVGYCQGMNYLAGYLYLTFEDEEVAYKIFDYVMKNHFFQYFIKDFEMLKLVFYQYERLLFIFLPNLHTHFKKQKVDASYYLTAWFITVFTQVYQFAFQSALLNIIWDIFIAQQWKGFYKCVLFILKFYERELLQLEFDQILHFIGDIIKMEMFVQPTEENLIKVLYKKHGNNKPVKEQILSAFKVSNSLLGQLENEFNCFSISFNQKLKEYNYK